jgi:hypothetical protein
LPSYAITLAEGLTLGLAWICTVHFLTSEASAISKKVERLRPPDSIARSVSMTKKAMAIIEKATPGIPLT